MAYAYKAHALHNTTIKHEHEQYLWISMHKYQFNLIKSSQQHNTQY